jgi:fucose permease
MPEEPSAKSLAFDWSSTMIGRLMGALFISKILRSQKHVFLELAAISTAAVIFTNAAFKGSLTPGRTSFC